MKNTMSYKRYDGSIELDEKKGVFWGRVLGIQEKITYQANNAVQLVKNFHHAIDSYLDQCRKENISPEEAFRGSFNIRIPSELHRKLALHAAHNHMNLNRLVHKILAEYKPLQQEDNERI